MTAGNKKVAPVDVEEAPIDDTTKAVAEVGAQPPATTGSLAMGEATGEIDAGDIKFPTVKVIQKMSENPSNLALGTITLDNTTVIGDADNNVRLTILSMHKYYREVLGYGEGVPQSFDSAAEAQQAGFRLARSKADRDAGVPIVEDAARAIVAIEKPEGAMDRGFPFELDGVRVIPAVWYLEKSTYRACAIPIFTKWRMELNTTGLLPAVWGLTSSVIKGTKGEYASPVITLLQEERSPEFVEQVKTQIRF
jgi:hypothetical protein